MKRTFSVLSVLALTLLMTVAALAQTPSTPKEKPEHLSKQQLKALIATAKTPAEHERIATYYHEQAQDYLAQSKEHEEMLKAYKQNNSLSNSKSRAGTIDHCQYFVEKFEEMSTKSQELAKLHEEMAKWHARCFAPVRLLV